jgi:hypothetical protein
MHAFAPLAIAFLAQAASAGTFISGSWYYGLASCGGKPFTPFNFTVNACVALDTDNLQVQFKGHSLRLTAPSAPSATATLVVFSDDACSVQPTNWGAVADNACQLSYWSTKYTFDTHFHSW